MNSEVIINIEHVTKEYRLGAIGGGTLKGDLQSFMAKIKGKSDPNAKIGQGEYSKNQKFLALNDVNIKVHKGERVGIIGHNGAGKSTLLKLLSRVTAPSKGKISYNGRIASMLEVGTGFHPELTGRENVYLNGAILGMTKAEIDKKFDDIVAFAEMEKFIDTPVKRYSSGMYVKLAFAVAAHLDSEIMVMDEVLAVGDMKFQQKCLGKMGEVSEGEGRTVLYVSHNMNTIRQLCTRCVVLDHGTVVFDGDVERAIEIYMDNYADIKTDVSLADVKRPEYLGRKLKCEFERITVIEPEEGIVRNKEPLLIEITWRCNVDIKDLKIRIEFSSMGQSVAASFSDFKINCKAGEKYKKIISVDVAELSAELYNTLFVLYEEDAGNSYDRDCVSGIVFEKVIDDESFITWNTRAWGNVRLNDFKFIVGDHYGKN